MEDFGDELRRLRLARGLSQDRLAASVGMSPKTIRKLENGTGVQPLPSTLGRVFNALELTDAERRFLLGLRGGSAAGDRSAMPGHVVRPGSVAPESVDLASAIRRLREIRGWTQQNLARKAGLHHRTISNLERGITTAAQPGTALRIARAAGLHGPELERLLAQARNDVAPEPGATADAGKLSGRVEELAAVVDLLQRRCLVLLVGPGGVGKTTLALAAVSAAGVAARVVELADQPSGSSLSAAMSRALTLDDASISAVIEALEGATLVVIDNVEHLDQVGPTLDALVAGLPGSRFLVTTRVTVPIATSDSETVALDVLDVAAAVALLRRRADRAGCVAPWTEPGPYEAICRQVDCLPLAIELAAAWSPVLSPEELLARLEQPLTLLDRPGTDRHRQDSVRSVVTWTLGLVSERARQFFVELTVHPTSFTLGLLECVHDREDLLDNLRELVDAQLLSEVAGVSPTRFRMLRVVREVGLELVPEEFDRRSVDERRAQWALRLAERSATELTGADQLLWLNRLDFEYEHFRLVVDHLRDTGSVRVVDLLGGIWRYWHLRSLYSRGREWLTSALATPEIEMTQSYGICLYGRAALNYFDGRIDIAVEDAQRALPILAEEDDHGTAGAVYSLLGMIDHYRGRPETAERWYRAGLDAVSAGGSERVQATLQGNLANLYGQGGRLGRAIDLVEEAIARFELLGDERSVADCTRSMASWKLATGAPVVAKAGLENALVVFRRLADQQGEVDTRLDLAETAFFLGDLAGAAAEINAAAPIVEELAEPWGRSALAAQRATLLFLQGRSDRALREARRSLVEAEPLDYTDVKIRALIVIGLCRADQNEPLPAARAAAAGLALESGHPILTAVLGLLVALLLDQLDRSDEVAQGLARDALAVLGAVPGWPVVDRLLAGAPEFAMRRVGDEQPDMGELRVRALKLSAEAIDGHTDR